MNHLSREDRARLMVWGRVYDGADWSDPWAALDRLDAPVSGSDPL